MEPGDVGDRLGELMAQAQQGDSAAYARLLHELLPLLRSRIRRKLAHAPQDTEDALQDVLISVHTARGTYDPQRPFLPWVMAIARNRVADAARRGSRRRLHEALVENLPETFSDAEENRYFEGYGDVEALRAAIGELPAGQRQAVELLKLEELSLKEASASTGMSISALKVASHRAIARLREILNGDARLENG